MQSIQHHLRNTFLAGIFAAIPLAATAFIIWYVEKTTRMLGRVFNLDVPFLGLVIAVAAIYLIGLFVTSILGRYFIGLVDRILSRVPVLRGKRRDSKMYAYVTGCIQLDLPSMVRRRWNSAR